MAKKPQIGVNLPPELYDWIIDTERWRDQSKTRLGIAGFVLFAIAEEKERTDALSLASLLDRDLISWEKILDCARRTGKAREAFLRNLWDAVTKGTLPVPAQEPAAAVAVRMAAKKLGERKTPKTRRHQRGA